MSGIDHAGTDWTRQPERGSPWLVHLILWIALHLGRSVARLLLYPISLYFLVAAPRQRRASARYLQRVGGGASSWGMVFRHIQHFAATILDRVFFLRGEFSGFDIRIDGAEHLFDALGGGRGCLLFGAHVGSFEALRAMAIRRRPFGLKILMQAEHNATLTQVFAALNPEVAATLIPLGSWDSMLRVQEALGQGEVVGLLADRAEIGADEIRCDFLGQSAYFPTGPALLARLTGTPVVLGLALYLGDNRYRLVFERIVMPPRSSQQSRTAWLTVATQAYVQALERHVRSAPLNWFNFYDFWRDDAPRN